MPSFSARIERNWIMRCVIVPPRVIRALGGGIRIPVLAAYAGERHLTTVMPAGRGRGRLIILTPFLRAAQLDAGNQIKVTVTRSLELREPVVPADLRAALQFRPTARDAFAQCPASLRRSMVAYLEQAKRAKTRQAYLELIIERLAERAQRMAARARRSGAQTPKELRPQLGAKSS